MNLIDDREETSKHSSTTSTTMKQIQRDAGRFSGWASLVLLLLLLRQSTTVLSFQTIATVSRSVDGVALAPKRTGIIALLGQSLSSSSKASDTTTTALAMTSDKPSLSDVGIVVLAGGTGSRMKASMPKQFLDLAGVPILHHSLDLFLERLPFYLRTFAREGPPYVVLVLDPMYQPDYQPILDRYNGRLVFANPGKERQGSVENGLNRLMEVSQGTCSYVAIHDSARPLVTETEVLDVVRDAKQYGAAVLGVPCKATIKESADGGVTVLRTIPRDRLWEVHTPQVIKIDTLQRGFAKVLRYNLAVTDDVSIVEELGEPVKLTRGEYTNLKITTPEDMDVAEAILKERGTTITNFLTAPSKRRQGSNDEDDDEGNSKRGLLRRLSFWKRR